jgi:4-hydroxy-2-oxoheptanedioate aldolase
MRVNHAKALVEAGRPAIGAWLSLASPLAAEHMASVGRDWLVVDTEHTPIGIETVLHCLQAITTTDAVPMMRVANNDPTLIKQALDTGALGVVVPMVMDGKRPPRPPAPLDIRRPARGPSPLDAGPPCTATTMLSARTTRSPSSFR